jgi:hypothetical protein
MDRESRRFTHSPSSHPPLNRDRSGGQIKKAKQSRREVIITHVLRNEPNFGRGTPSRVHTPASGHRPATQCRPHQSTGLTQCRPHHSAGLTQCRPHHSTGLTQCRPHTVQPATQYRPVTTLQAGYTVRAPTQRPLKKILFGLFVSIAKTCLRHCAESESFSNETLLGGGRD